MDRREKRSHQRVLTRYRNEDENEGKDGGRADKSMKSRQAHRASKAKTNQSEAATERRIRRCPDKTRMREDGWEGEIGDWRPGEARGKRQRLTGGERNTFILARAGVRCRGAITLQFMPPSSPIPSGESLNIACMALR